MDKNTIMESTIKYNCILGIISSINTHLFPLINLQINKALNSNTYKSLYLSHLNALALLQKSTSI